jgi:hypothetical protein
MISSKKLIKNLFPFAGISCIKTGACKIKLQTKGGDFYPWVQK